MSVTLKIASDALPPMSPFLIHLLTVDTLAPTTRSIADGIIISAHLHCLRFLISGELMLRALLMLAAALVALALLFDARVSVFFDLVNVHEAKIWLR